MDVLRLNSQSLTFRATSLVNKLGLPVFLSQPLSTKEKPGNFAEKL